MKGPSPPRRRIRVRTKFARYQFNRPFIIKHRRHHHHQTSDRLFVPTPANAPDDGGCRRKTPVMALRYEVFASALTKLGWIIKGMCDFCWRWRGVVHNSRSGGEGKGSARGTRQACGRLWVVRNTWRPLSDLFSAVLFSYPFYAASSKCVCV